MSKPNKQSQLPNDSIIKTNMPIIDFSDSFMIRTTINNSIDEIYTKLFTLPKWIQFMLKARYYLFVKPFGLSTGRKTIPIIFKNEKEIVIGEDDKHLYFRISILKYDTIIGTEIYLTTVVKFNNQWGRLYFAFIKLFHKLVCKSMLKSI